MIDPKGQAGQNGFAITVRIFFWKLLSVYTLVAKTTKKITKPVPASFLGIPYEKLGPLLALVGAMLYLQTVTFEFTQDDAIVITDNMFTTQGVKGISGLLGHDTFYGYFKDESKLRLVSGGRYRPLTPVMFAIENEIAGLKPWFHHFISAISYGALCWILFGFLREFLSSRFTAQQATRIAAVSALIFALHPLHTEVVANIKGRDEIIAAMGAIAGLWLTLRSIKEDSWLVRGGAALVFLLGMMSKENVITMLGVVPLTLWWFQKNKNIRWIPALLPIVMASFLFLVIRGSVTGWDQGKPPMELMNNPFLKIENDAYKPFTVAEKSATVMYTMGKYVQLLVFPYPLTHDYYPRHIDIMSWSDPLVIVYALMWLALFYIAFKGLRQKTWWSYGILFYMMTMSITSNILFPIGTNMSERFAFLPSVGFAFIAGYAYYRLTESVRFKKIATPLLLIILVAYAGWTLVRSRVWKDNHTLFTTDIHTSARSAKLLNAMGGDLVTGAEKEENKEKREQMLRDAQGYLARALEIHPNYKLSYLLLGNSHFHLGEYDKAITYFRHVLTLDPMYVEGRRNLGVALREAGRVKGEQENNLAGAISLLQEAVTLIPDDFQTYHLLGVAFGQKGDIQQAIQYFQKEIELAPKNATAYYNLGIAYRQAGNMAAANENFEKARTLDPNLPQFKNQQ